MATMQTVADKYDIGKFTKYDSRHFGKIVEPRVFRTKDDKYFLKADAYVPNCDVSLIDYHTGDYHLFDSKQEAISAWVGRKPQGTGWSH